MARGELFGERAHLPPLDAWKKDPQTLRRIELPVDDRGFVKPKAGIEVLLDLFEDSYEWPVDWSKDAPQICKPDDHHFYWPAADYWPDSLLGAQADIPYRFRESIHNRGRLPRQFHNVWHNFTLPPVMPAVRYMKWNLESFESAKVLFEYAQKAMIIDGLFMGTDDPIRQEDYMVQYDELFNALRLAAAKAVGSGALKLLGIEQEIDVRSPSDICSMLGKLDIIASKRIPNYTEEYFAHVA